MTGVVFKHKNSASTNELRAPGMLKSHYSPTTPLKITPIDELKELVALDGNSRKAFIFQNRPEISVYQRLTNVYWLSESGEALDISQNLYQTLRTTDTLNYETIHIEAINESEGLLGAIKDRLLKAASL